MRPSIALFPFYSRRASSVIVRGDKVTNSLIRISFIRLCRAYRGTRSRRNIGVFSRNYNCVWSINECHFYNCCFLGFPRKSFLLSENEVFNLCLCSLHALLIVTRLNLASWVLNVRGEWDLAYLEFIPQLVSARELVVLATCKCHVEYAELLLDYKSACHTLR